MSATVADVMTRKVIAVRLDGVVAVRDRLDYLSVPPVHIYGPLA